MSYAWKCNGVAYLNHMELHVEAGLFADSGCLATIVGTGILGEVTGPGEVRDGDNRTVQLIGPPGVSVGNLTVEMQVPADPMVRYNGTTNAEGMASVVQVDRLYRNGAWISLIGHEVVAERGVQPVPAPAEARPAPIIVPIM